MPKMTEEDLIKRRLIFDGDGTGEERKLNLLQKLICKWVKTELPLDEQRELLDKILNLLRQCEAIPEKTKLTEKHINKQIKNFKETQLELENKSVAIRAAIEQAKETLKKSTQVKQSKMMYDLLITEILKHPNREESLEIINKHRTEISALNQERLTILDKFENLKKHIHLFTISNNLLLNDVTEIENLPKKTL